MGRGPNVVRDVVKAPQLDCSNEVMREIPTE
jgi:hypothetical protein